MAITPRRILRWLLIPPLVLLLLLVLALPSIVRSTIISQASQALHTEVSVGQVDVSLWNGRIRVQDLAVHSPSGKDERFGSPLIGWRLFQVTLSYRDLFRKMIRIREVVLDTPHVALDRLADGKLNLQQLVATPKEPGAEAKVPPVEAPKAAEPAPAGSAWGFALDRFVLRGGGLKFRDLLMPQSQPLAIDVPAIEVADVSFQPGQYGQPARAVLDVRSEGSHVRITARTEIVERGVDVEADLEATGLPLRRARLYVPGVGWSALDGLADASLRYRLRTETENVLSGSVTVRKLAVSTSGLDRPALAWDRLLVKLEPVDLLKRSANVSLVELRGASVVASLQGGEVLPVIAPQPGAAPAPPPAPAPEVVAEAKEPAAPSAPPWKWQVKEVRIADSRLFLQRPGEPLPIGVRLSVHDLAPEPDKVAHVELGLDVGAGSFETKGSLRISPPAFGGTLRYDQLELPLLLSAAANVPQTLVESATLGGELAVEAGLDRGGGAASAEDLRVSGRLTVDNLHVVGADPKAFAAGWKRLEIAIDDARVPGALAPSTRPQAVRVDIGRVRVDEPFARLTRSPEGIILPELGAKAADEKKPNEPAPRAAPAAKPAATAPAPDVRVGAIELRGGRVAIVDRTVKPYFTSELRPIEIEAKGVRSAGPSVEAFRLSLAGFQQGKVEIRGNLKADGKGSIEIDGKRVGLTPFNPYVVTASSYSLGGGSLSIDTKVVLAKDRYDTQSKVTVHQLGLQGAEGDTLFSQQFGIPLSTALALLTDLNGDITIDVPVVVDHGATKVDIGAVLRSALKSAIVGAVVSPLKLIGMAAGRGETVGSIEPPPLAMQTGRADPSAEGVEQIAQVANLLATRPGVGLKLTGQVSASDVRWLHEQKLRAELEKGPGVFGTITGLPARNARKRILEALVERAASGAGNLSEDDAKQLEEWLKDEAAPSSDEIAKLAKGRAERLVAALRDDHGIEERRLTVVDGEAPGAASAGGVKIALGLPGP